MVVSPEKLLLDGISYVQGGLPYAVRDMASQPAGRQQRAVVNGGSGGDWINTTSSPTQLRKGLVAVSRSPSPRRGGRSLAPECGVSTISGKFRLEGSGSRFSS